MSFESVAIALPIRDRRTSHAFFSEVFGMAMGSPRATASRNHSSSG